MNIVRKILVLVLVIAWFESLPVMIEAQSNSTDIITAVAWSPDGENVAYLFQNGLLEILDIGTNQILFSHVFSEGDGGLVWHPTNTGVLAIGSGPQISVWNIQSNTELFNGPAGTSDGVAQTEFGNYPETVVQMVWSRSGNFLASLSMGSTIQVWNTTTWAITLDVETRQATSITWDIDESRLYLASGVAIRIIDTTTGDIQKLNENSLIPQLAPSIDLNPDGTKLVNSTILGDVIVWSTTGELLIYSSIPVVEDDRSTIISMVRWNPVGDQFASVGIDGMVRIWDGTTAEQLTVIDTGSPVWSVDWSPDGSQLVYGGENNLREIVQLPTAAAGPDQTLPDDSSGTESITLDGSASSDPDGTIVAYSWADSTDTEIATGPTPTVELSVGVHTLTLTVTDDDGLTASDDVVITVTVTWDNNLLTQQQTPLYELLSYESCTNACWLGIKAGETTEAELQ